MAACLVVDLLAADNKYQLNAVIMAIIQPLCAATPIDHNAHIPSIYAQTYAPPHTICRQTIIYERNDDVLMVMMTLYELHTS